MSKILKLTPKKTLLIRKYKNILKNDLEKVSAYDDKRIVKIDVFVNIKLSNVPWFWANLISLEKTDIDENIKSINAIPIKKLKKPEYSTSNWLFAMSKSEPRRAKKAMAKKNIIPINWIARLNL